VANGTDCTVEVMLNASTWLSGFDKIGADVDSLRVSLLSLVTNDRYNWLIVRGISTCDVVWANTPAGEDDCSLVEEATRDNDGMLPAPD
jgi:hypothetical protein